MRKHQVNILLLKVIKRFAFRQNTPNQFVGYFDAAFLIRGTGIAIENKTAKLIVFILFDGDRKCLSIFSFGVLRLGRILMMRGQSILSASKRPAFK